MKPYQIINRNFKCKNIDSIYQNFILNKPSVGVDGINIKSFKEKAETEISIINNKFLNQTYNFSFYKEKLISKGKEKFPRVISIPTIRDKITLKIIFKSLYEIFKDDLSNELIHVKISKIITAKNHFDSFIKLDIENFYPTINHDILMSKIYKKTKKNTFISLLKKAITQDTVSKSSSDAKKYQNKIGIPQGLSISNILASIYLSDLDKKYSLESKFQYFRYVDDILILCKNEDIESTFESIKKDMEDLKLTVHKLGISSQKTEHGKIEDGFYFLGYFYNNKLTSVRESSINRVRNSIIDIFTQYKYSDIKNINLLYWKLNLKITGCKFKDKKYGWLYFFSQITDNTLIHQLDLFVENLFYKTGVIYDNKKIKKFTRAYFEILKNRRNTNYIPNFSEMSKTEKKALLENIFGIFHLKSHQIEARFDNIIYKNIKEMEKDIQMY
jgi:RNA-directed DNA polymerase